MEYLLTAAFGLLAGGFLNVVADRIAPLDPEADGPFIADRPRKLALWELLPIASLFGALALRRMVIPNNRARYPVLEIAVASAFALTWHAFGSVPWQAIAMSGFTASFLTLAAVDFESKYLPYKLSIPTLCIALAVSPLLIESRWWEGYAAAACSFAFFYGIHLIGRKLDRPLMGDGDAYLAAALAALLGISYTLVGLYITALAGGLFALGVVAAKVFGYEARVIPYGPFLTIGGLASLYFGPDILDWVRI